MSIPFVKRELNKHIKDNSHCLGRLAAPSGASSAEEPNGAPSPASAAKPRRAGAALAVMGILACIPGAMAQDVVIGFEGFEDQIAGSDPLPSESETGAPFYSYVEQGTGSQGNGFVDNAVFQAGARSLKADFSGASAGNYLLPNFEFESSIETFCGSSYALTFDFRIDALSASQQYFILSDGGRGDAVININNMAGFYVDNTNTRFVAIYGTATATETAIFFGITPLPDTWYRVVMYDMECTGTENIRYELTDLDNTVTSEQVINDVAGTFTGDLDRLTISACTNAATCTLSDVWIDNLQITTPPPGEPGSRFCASPFEENFGYTYIEDVEYDPEITAPFSGINDGFVFDGDASDSGYLAKGFNVGGVALAVNFTIEARQEGAASLFRASFTAGGGGLPSALNKGDGTDGGNFDDHIGVRIEEVGSVWNIGIYQNVGGTGYNRIGPSLSFGNPDNVHNFRFEIDSRDLTAKLYAEGLLLMTRTFDTSFGDTGDGEVWFDQWFVGKGIDNFVNLNALTTLNDNDGNADSTCIFDLIGGVEVNGSEGSAPHSSIPPLGGGGGGDGDGIGDSILDNKYFWVLLWISFAEVAIAALSWATRAGFPGLVYGTTAGAVYIIGVLIYGATVISPWPIIAILAIIIGLAIARFAR